MYLALTWRELRQQLRNSKLITIPLYTGVDKWLGVVLPLINAS